MRKRTIKDISVEGFQRRKPGKRVVYSIKVAWSDRSVNLIYRRYGEMRQLELNLLETFPSDKQYIIASSLQERRKVTPTSVETKVERMRDFVSNLMALPEHISQSPLVTNFFTSRIEDVEWLELESNHQPRSKSKLRKKFSGKISVRRKHSKSEKCIGEPVLLEQYVAVKDYKKQHHNDISLTNGYTMGVIEKHESGWWLVECEGDVGWVPASFIQPTGGDNNSDGDDLTTETFPHGRGEMHITTQAYQAKMDDEISFDIGVHLQVIEKTLDGWWRVIYMDEEGWVPAVYLKRLDITAGNTPMCLRRLSGMSMRLREEASELQDVPDGGSTLLKPVWDTVPRRHSASDAIMDKSADGELKNMGNTVTGRENPSEHREQLQKFPLNHMLLYATRPVLCNQALLSTSVTEFLESSLSKHRSSLSDIRDALPNRGLCISAQDIRLADDREEECRSFVKVKRNRSCRALSEDFKEFFGKGNKAGSVSCENLTTTNDMVKKTPRLSMPRLSTSASDLRIAELHEVSKKAKRSRSFSLLSDNIMINEIFGKRNETEGVLSENSNAAVNVAMSRSRLDLPRLENEYASPSPRRRFSGGQRQQNVPQKDAIKQFSLPTILITPPNSGTKLTMELEVENQLPNNCTNGEITRVGENMEEAVDEEEKKEEKGECKQINVAEEACSKKNGANRLQGEEHKQKLLYKHQDTQEVTSDELSGNENKELRKGERTGDDKITTGVFGKDVEKDKNVLSRKEKENTETQSQFRKDDDIYYAVASYVANGVSEITVCKGDELKVEAKAPNGWWMVRIGDETGWAPSNFLVAGDEYLNEDYNESQESEVDQDGNGLPHDDDDYHVNGDKHDDHNDDDDDDDGDDGDNDDSDGDNDDSGGDNDGDYDEDNDDNDDDEDDDDDDDDGEPVVWMLPAWKTRPHLDADRGARLVSPRKVQRPPAWILSNEYAFVPVVKDRYATRSSSGTESSSTVGKTRFKMKGKKSSESRESPDNHQGYEVGRVRSQRSSYKSSGACKVEGYTSPKRRQSSSARRRSSNSSSCDKCKRSPSSKRSLLLKQRHVGSYDSGYLEDERRKVLKKTRQFVSQPGRNISHPTSQHFFYRKCHSEGNGRDDVWHFSESSDDEVFPVMKTNKDSSSYDSEVASYDLQKKRERRNKINRSRYSPDKVIASNSCSRGGRGMYQAIAMYQATTDDTIDLYEGDQVQVIRKSRGGWWYVKIDDEEGWTPSNFLEPITRFN